MLKALAAALLAVAVTACGAEAPSAAPGTPATSPAGSAGSAVPVEPSAMPDSSSGPAEPTAAAPAPGTSGSLPLRGSVHGYGERIRMAIAPEGLYVLIPARKVRLALLDDMGDLRPGWPVTIKKATDCSPPLPVADGTVRVVCSGDWHKGQRAFAFDPAGRALAGWPVDVKAARDWLDARVIGDELMLVVSGPTKNEDEVGWPIQERWLVAVAAGGVIREGVRVSGHGSAALGPDGVGYGVAIPYPGEPEASLLTALDLDGARSGFPVSVHGVASPPSFAPDGRLYVTVGTYDYDTPSSHVIVLGPDGRMQGGGTGPLRITTAEANSEALVAPEAPLLSGDGSAFVFGFLDGDTRAVSIDPAGAVRSGWPYRTSRTLVRPGCPWLEGELGCFAGPADPAVGPADLLYLLLGATRDSGGRILALEPDGEVRAGWPVTLKGSDSEFWSIVVGAEGTAYALAVERESATRYSATILALAPDSSRRWSTTIVEP